MLICVSLQSSKRPLQPERMATLFELTKDNGVLFGKGGLQGNVSHAQPLSQTHTPQHNTHTQLAQAQVVHTPPADPTHPASLVCNRGRCEVCTACTEGLPTAVLVEREWEWGLKVGCRLELNFCTLPLPIPLYILVLLQCNYFFTGIGVFSRILGPKVHPREGGGGLHGQFTLYYDV